MAYAKIRPRRGTLAEWNAVNPILSEGEFAIENPETGVGTGLCKFKIGDGVTPWQDLPYAFDASAASAVYGGDVYEYNYICLRTGTTEEWESENPVLALGEIVYDVTTNTIYVGDGTSTFTELTGIGGEEDWDWDFGDMDEEELDPDYDDYDFGIYEEYI